MQLREVITHYLDWYNLCEAGPFVAASPGGVTEVRQW